MSELISQPWQFDFMRDAAAMAAAIAVVAGLLSPFVVLRGWALMGDAVSHAVLPGVVLAYVLSLPYVIGAFLAGLGCAVLAGVVSDHSRLKSDTVLGVVFSAMFGLGLVLFSQIETGVHLDHVLLGDLLGVLPADLRAASFAALAMALGYGLLRRALMAWAFDPHHARSIGLPVRVLHYAMLAMMALSVVLSLKAVGLILGIAMLVAPGVIAQLLCRRFEQMVLLSVAVSVGSALTGLWASYWLNSAPGPTIVMVQVGLFLVSLLFAFGQGRRRRAAA